MINWGILGFGNMGKQFSNCFDDSSEIFSLKHVDGGLIGGASLIASEFCKIYDTL